MDDAQRQPDEQERMSKLASELREQQLPEFRQPKIDPELQRILAKHNL